MTPKDFTAKFYPFAQQSEATTGINRFVSLAQLALESGWGETMSGDNNGFGIKLFKGMKYAYKLCPTFEYHKNPNLTPEQIGLESITSCQPSQTMPGFFIYKGPARFCSFKDMAEGFVAHSDVFFKNPRYAEALKVKSDPEAFVKLIAPIYAQAPTYAAEVISIMNTIKKYIPK